MEVHHLQTRMDKQAFNQLLVTGICESDEVDYLDSFNIESQIIRIEELGRSVRFLSDILAFFKLRAIMKRYDPHIVHTHTAKAGFLGRVASLSLMRNHVRVHTYHGHLLFGYFSKIKTRTIILIEKLLSNFTDALISVGNSVKEELIASGIGKEEKFHTIRPGIDFDSLLLSTSSDVELGITNEDFVVVWIGRFAEIKRPDRLLEIAKLAKSRGVKTKFLAVGDGILRKVIESESRSLNLNIDFLGWRTDVGSILRSADLLVLTSDNEGTPIVIMEAQVLGVPVVACDVGSVKEIVVNGQTGFVDDYNGEKFLNLIQKLNNEPGLLEHMSSNAGDFAQSEFTVKNFISSHENLYLELLSKKFGKTRDL